MGEFSDNKGRQRIYTSGSYSSDPVCATDQALKQCHQQKVEKCNCLSSGPCPRAIKEVKPREKIYQALQQRAESLGMRLTFCCNPAVMHGRNFKPYT